MKGTQPSLAKCMPVWLALALLGACGVEGEDLAPGQHALDVPPVTFGGIVTSDIILDRDLVSPYERGFGLYIAADDITIDGNGHALIYTGVLDGTDFYGIKNPGSANVTIKNFSRISGFDTGIHTAGANVTIENCQIEGNAVAGVKAWMGDGLTLRGNSIRERNIGVELDGVAAASLTDNTLRGGRVGLLQTAGSLQTFSGNELEHQSQSTMQGNRRLFRFAQVRRSGQVGDVFDFSLEMFSIDGSASASSVATVRTSPAESVTLRRSGNTVMGSFRASRPGLYSLVAEVQDTAGNTSMRLARIFVGALAKRTTRYYLSDRDPQNGQSPRGLKDNAAMFLEPPATPGHIECGGWVQESADELPGWPAALLTRVDFGLMMRFSTSTSWPPKIGLQWDVSYGGTPEEMTSLPQSWGDGVIAWREASIDGFETMLDYPEQWHHLGIYVLASEPYVLTGDPQGASHVIFHHGVTSTPEVTGVAPAGRLLLAATADPGHPGSARVTLGGGDAAEIDLAAFRRPFREGVTRIGADGRAQLRVLAHGAERTFETVPLEVTPRADAVEVEINLWQSAGAQVRRWTEKALGQPGIVGHLVDGLTPGGRYRVSAGGTELSVHDVDSSGRFAFSYSGNFPVVLEITAVASPQPPKSDAGAGVADAASGVADAGTPSVDLAGISADSHVIASADRGPVVSEADLNASDAEADAGASDAESDAGASDSVGPPRDTQSGALEGGVWEDSTPGAEDRAPGSARTGASLAGGCSLGAGPSGPSAAVGPFSLFLCLLLRISVRRHRRRRQAAAGLRP